MTIEGHKTSTCAVSPCPLPSLSSMLRSISRTSLIAVNLTISPAFFSSGPLANHYQDSAGWTVFTPSMGTGSCGNSSSNYTGTCIVYVSADGNDSTCTSFVPPVTDRPANSCATLAGALARTRTKNSTFKDGRPDWILFKRGDTFFPNNVVTLGDAVKGRSKSEPMLIGAYGPGTARWTIDFKNNTSRTPWLQLDGINGSIAVVDCHMTNSGKDPASPDYSRAALQSTSGHMMNARAKMQYLHIENCLFQYAGGPVVGPVVGSGYLSEVVIRRNLYRNFYTSFNSGNPSPLPASGWRPREGGNAIFAAPFEKLLVEENLLYEPSTMLAQTTGGTVTISLTDPAVITWTDAGLPPAGMPPEGSVVGFTTTGALPTGIANAATNCTKNQCYYLRNVDAKARTANISRFKTGGTLIRATGSQSGIHTAHWVDPQANIYIHNCYFDLGWETSNSPTLNGMVFRNNITSYAAATGCQTRPGGVLFNNLFLRNPIQITCCAWPTDISYNVFLEGSGMRLGIAENPYGWGINIDNFTCGSPARGACIGAWINKGLPTPGTAGSTFHHNIMAHSISAPGNGVGIRLVGAQCNALGFCTPAVTGVMITDNVICGWPTGNNTPIDDRGVGNKISANKTNTGTDCKGLGFSDPDRTVGAYYETIGGPPGATTDEFLDAAWSKWNKVDWDPRFLPSAVNTYIRGGFDMANPPGGSPAPPPVP